MNSNELMLFNASWNMLSFQGKCDGFGGREYVRILKEYIDKYCPHFNDCSPTMIEKFIIERA